VLDVERAEDLRLLLGVQVRRVAGHVGHGRRLVDAAEGIGEAGHAAGLEDALDDGLVLPGQLVGPVGVAVGLDGLLDPHPEGVARAGHAGADHRPAQTPDDQRPHPAPQLAGVLDLGHRADGRVPAVDAGHEEELAVHGGVRPGAGLGGLQGDGDDHLRQHHSGAERQDRQGRCRQVVRRGFRHLHTSLHIKLE
jgi:hypothetical protein